MTSSTPDVELGIMVAASSQRELVQRLGKVIRNKADGQPGKLVVVFSRDTVEDPAVRGGRGFPSRAENPERQAPGAEPAIEPAEEPLVFEPDDRD